MKKFITVIFVTLFCVMQFSVTSAQKWNYLTRPLPENLFVEKKVSTATGLKTIAKIAEKNFVTLFKLNGAISTGALTYNSETKSLEPGVWIGAGPILSFRQYKADELGTAYQTFGVGAGAILGTTMADINLSALKAVLCFEIGKLFSFGYGYSVVTNTPSQRHSLLFNTRFDF